MRQSTGKVKTGQLWSKNKEDLSKQLKELKTELGQLRTQKIAGGSASKLTKMYVLSLSSISTLQAGGRKGHQQAANEIPLQPRSPKVSRKGPHSH
jgi:ribosomal protein L29